MAEHLDYRGRFAPSPTGPLHFGSLVTAVASWLDARRHGGVWLIRMDDLDPPREVPGAADTILEQLHTFGLIPDEPVLWQSRRTDAYAGAVRQLLQQGDAFHCALSRKDLAARNGIHPGSSVAVGPGPDRAVRLKVPEKDRVFDDLLQGRQRVNLQHEGGAFVIRRRDGLYAYQLACALDDADTGITHVIRGADLMASTPRQQLILERLRRRQPVYGHLPVLVDDDGEKLSKSAGAATLDMSDVAGTLHRALRALDQSPPSTLSDAPPREQLDWARRHWNPEGLRGRRSIRARPFLRH